MLDRQRNESQLSQFVNLHPFYSSLGAAGSLATLTMGLEYSPALIIALPLFKKLYDEFKDRFDSPHRVESQFRNAEYQIKGVTIGELTHHDGMPVVKIYSKNLHLSAMTEAYLMAPYFPDFHNDYFWYLFTLARAIHGPWNMSAVDFINQEVRRRGLQIDDSNLSRHYVLKELYKQTWQYNQNAPFWLQRNSFKEKDLIAIGMFCEVMKGLGRANGCSTAVIDKNGNKTMVRLLDWFTFGSFQKWQIKIAKPVPNVGEGKPKFVFVSTIVPGIPAAITAYNDGGLAVAYNEVGGKTGNRQNPNGGWPGLDLTYKIAAECNTFADAEKLLETSPPASANNLIIAADRKGVVQSMPNGSDKNFNILDRDKRSCVSTNHFRGADEEAISESAVIMGPVVGSIPRYDRMKAAVSDEKMSPEKIAKSASTKDTVEVHIYDQSTRTVRINTANKNAASAPDRTKAKNEDGKHPVHYTTFKLNDVFETLENRTQETQRALSEKMPLIEAGLDTDKALIYLVETMHSIGQTHPALAEKFSDFYSALTEQCALSELSQKPAETLLQPVDIQFIATQGANVILAVKNKSKNIDGLISDYETAIQRVLPARSAGSSYLFKAPPAVIESSKAVVKELRVACGLNG